VIYGSGCYSKYEVNMSDEHKARTGWHSMRAFDIGNAQEMAQLLGAAAREDDLSEEMDAAKLAALKEKIFSPRSIVNLESGTAQQFAEYSRKDVGKKLEKAEESKFSDQNFPLGQVILLNITATHFMMNYLTDEVKREQFAFKRTKELVRYVRLIFAHTIPPTPTLPEQFYEDLEQSLYMSTLFSYSEEGSRKFAREYMLLGAYNNLISLRELKNKQASIYQLCQQTFDFGELVSADTPAILKQVQLFNAKIFQEYQATTEPPQKPLTKMLFVLLIAGIVTLLSYTLGIDSWWLLVPSLIGLALGARFHNWYQVNLASRALTQGIVDSYGRTVDIRYGRVKETITQQDKQCMALLMRQGTLAQKARFSIYCHFRHLLNLAWKQWGVGDAVAKAGIARERSPKEVKSDSAKVAVYGLDYNSIGASTSGVGSYDYDTAYNSYQRVKKKKPSTTPTFASAPAPAKVPPTYRRVTYHLSYEQQRQGFLAMDVQGCSKGFFKFPNYQNLVDPSKVKEGVWSGAFMAAQGEFGGLKYMKGGEYQGSYEWKFFNGERYIFKKTEQRIDIGQGNSEDREQVPCWEIERAFTK
jgi:hypothetical protein